MMKNKNAAAGLVSTDDSWRDQACQQDLPNFKYTTRNAVVQVVEQFLLTRLENAFSTRKLVDLTNLGVRGIHAQVARNWDAGVRILVKADRGYYLQGKGKKGRDELQYPLFTMYPKVISLWLTTVPLCEEMERQVMEVQEDGKT